MYTLCPECGVAFSVTAEVLKQAAGKVRCGGCGVAFNALAHLSEDLPAAQSGPDPEPNESEISFGDPGELAADHLESLVAEPSLAAVAAIGEKLGDASPGCGTVAPVAQGSDGRSLEGLERLIGNSHVARAQDLR